MVAYLFYTLFFLVPLVFFPRSSEVFEFNKIIVVYIFTVLIVASWAIRMIRQKKIIFRRTILDVPLLLFIASQLISTILSIDMRTSFFGYYSRFNGGFLSTICYCLLYWAFVSNIKKINIKYILYSLLISSAIVAVYGVLEHFGHSFSCLFVAGKFSDDCWVQDVQSRVFATLGQPNWLAAMLVALTPLSWSFALKRDKTEKKIQNTLIWTGVSILFFACILFTKSRSGLLGLAAADLIFWSGILYTNWKKKEKKIDKKIFKNLLIFFTAFHFLFLVTILIFGTAITPSLNDLFSHTKQVATVDTSEGGTESGAIRAIVWKGSIDIWKHNPIFGTGVETFGYSYWQYRPVAHNNTSEWDFLYNKAHNEYLNYAANSGTIGIVTYLILIGGSIFVMRKNPALLAGYVSILVTNFFGFSVVIVSLLTFLMPAIAIAAELKEEKESKEDADDIILPFGAVIVVSGILLFLIGRYWFADYLYEQSQLELNSASYSASVKDMQSAINYSPYEAIYHNQMARVFTEVSVGLLDNNSATDAAKIAPYAINESDTAFNLSPRNMNIRETRINIYMQLSNFDPPYFQMAINLIKDTMIFSPTDPKLHLLLGKSYANMGEINQAISEFKNALSLKPDYADAKKDLDVVLKLQGDKNGIISHGK